MLDAKRRPQPHSLRELSAATQLLSVADGRFAHPKMPIQPYANKFAPVCLGILLLR